MSAVGLGTLQLANLILCDPDLNSEKPVKRGALRAAWHGPAKVSL